MELWSLSHPETLKSLNLIIYVALFDKKQPLTYMVSNKAVVLQVNYSGLLRTLFILDSQCHSWWWPGNAWNQGIPWRLSVSTEEKKTFIVFAVKLIDKHLIFVWADYAYSICSQRQLAFCNGPLARYVKLRVARAPGMPGMFPRHRGLAIPTWILSSAWRTRRDACRDR